MVYDESILIFVPNDSSCIRIVPCNLERYKLPHGSTPTICFWATCYMKRAAPSGTPCVLVLDDPLRNHQFESSASSHLLGNNIFIFLLQTNLAAPYCISQYNSKPTKPYQSINEESLLKSNKQSILQMISTVNDK